MGLNALRRLGVDITVSYLDNCPASLEQTLPEQVFVNYVLGQYFARLIWRSASSKDNKIDECIKESKRQRLRDTDSGRGRARQLLGSDFPARSVGRSEIRGNGRF